MTSQQHLIARHKRRMLALREYTRLASAIPEVVYISLSDDFESDVFTHVEGGDEQSIFERLVDAELKSLIWSKMRALITTSFISMADGLSTPAATVASSCIGVGTR